jgi:benzoyl-CoA 2,3-dioxygenase component B
MLTEEAHHMFVGESGVSRVIERTCQAMREAGITDPADVGRVRALGVIDLPLIQRKMNLHFSLTLDLFGNEISTNAANAFNAGVKGRYHEDRIDDDHVLRNATYPVLRLRDGAVVEEQAPALSALNMRLRDDFVADAAVGSRKWNAIIQRAGFAYRLVLPHVAFNRRIGEFAGLQAGIDGALLDDVAWTRAKDGFLPSADDNAYLTSLMRPVHEPGRVAGWIAPPKWGVDGKPGEFEYVRIEG